MKRLLTWWCEYCYQRSKGVGVRESWRLASAYVPPPMPESLRNREW